MRAGLWLVVVAGCGRLGFEHAAADATTDAVDVVSVDPRDLPPFGAPVRVDALSMAGVEDDDPCLSRDGLEVVFSSSRMSTSEDLWIARRASVADPWNAPDRIDELSTNVGEDQPYFTADALTLYYTSGTSPTQDIWVATRPTRDAPFTNPTKVAELSTTANDGMGAVDVANTVAVINYGSTVEISESQRAAPDQPWGPPVLITALNGAARSGEPHLDDTAHVIYFARGQPDDIVWSMRARVGDPWSSPVTVTELATGAVETDPWLSPDLRTIYFVRYTGADANKDIFMATR